MCTDSNSFAGTVGDRAYFAKLHGGELMGYDARVRYTKMVIRDSIIKLIQEKPFHRISLTEVCRMAEINRTTFYKYYHDIYDWKEQFEQECIQRVEDILSECAQADLRSLRCQQFRDMREHAELYGSIPSPNFESSVLSIMMAMILEKADEETRKNLLRCAEQEVKRRWDCYFVIYGCNGVIECWLKDGMREEPQALADYYLECLGKCLGSPLR